MEGYLNLRIQPWLRRIITRVLAIAPALLTILLLGESATGKLLILSQVILSLQLGFAVIPLIHFVSNKKTMGVFAISKKTQFFAWLSAAIIVVLNAKLVAEQLIDWINTAQHPLVIWLTAVPAALLAAILLMYIIISPLLQKLYTPKSLTPHKSTINQIPVFTQPSYKKIAITVDFSTTDNEALKHAVAQGGTNAEYLLIHIVETAGALLLGNEISDLETTNDTESMALYASQMILKGYKVETRLGYGSPKKAIPKIVKDYNADILVMGAHGHRMLKDIIFGTTIDTVRHNVTVPVMIVRA
jgi:manganese transport protein